MPLVFVHGEFSSGREVWYLVCDTWLTENSLTQRPTVGGAGTGREGRLRGKKELNNMIERELSTM